MNNETVTVKQVKDTFEEVFCSGCCADCTSCKAGINRGKLFNVLDNLAIINEIDKNLKGENT